MCFNRTFVCSSGYDPIVYLAICGFVFWNATFEQMFWAIRCSWSFSLIVILSSIIFFAFLHMCHIEITVAQRYHLYLNQLLKGMLSYNAFLVTVAVTGLLSMVALVNMVFVWVAYFLLFLLLVNFLRVVGVVRDELLVPFCFGVLFLVRFWLKVVFPGLEIY